MASSSSFAVRSRRSVLKVFRKKLLVSFPSDGLLRASMGYSQNSFEVLPHFEDILLPSSARWTVRIEMLAIAASFS